MTDREQLDRLLRAVGERDTLLILTHNNPDPDAIASAVALRHLLSRQLRTACHIAYQGLIGRAENRALVRYLGHPLHPLSHGDLQRFSGAIVVDAQPGAGNLSMLPRPGWPLGGPEVVAVVDSHTVEEDTASTSKSRFVDVRPGLGATSTILTGYLRAAGAEPETSVATALFYGIKTNTMGLGRNASADDAAAYFWLQPRVDVEALTEIEHAQVPVEYFRSFDQALRVARMVEGVLFTYIGALNYPDLVAEIADILLRLEKAQWVICLGTYERAIHISVRTRSRDRGAELLAQAMMGQDGTAGGQGSMAGGRVPLRDRDPQQVADLLRARALEAMGISPEASGEPLV